LSLFESLHEQVVFGFTGRVNVLKRSNSQFIAVVMLKDGKVVSAKYEQKVGRKAFFNLLMKDKIHEQEWKYVIEPELIGEESVHFSLNFEDIKKEFEELSIQFSKAHKLRPPKGIRLVINGDFILDGAGISATEFDILCLISEYSNVDEVYARSSLYEYEVTNALVTLRQKKALKVYR
jgi:hypothetical protein